MRKLYLVCWLVCLVGVGQGQSIRKLDSLELALSKLLPEGRSYQSDTLRINLLYEMGMVATQPDSAIVLLQKALNIANRRKSTKHSQKMAFGLGRKNKLRGTYFEAIEWFYNSLHSAEQLNDKYHQALCYLEIANSYVWINQPQKSHSIYKAALQLFKSLKLYEDYADCLNNLAVSYHDTKQYDKAIVLLKQCLTYKPYIKGQQSMPSFYSNLGSAYREKGDYKTAVFYFNKSLTLQRKETDYRIDYAFLLTEIAKNYLSQNDLDNAISYALRSKVAGNPMNGVRYDANEILYEAYKKKDDQINALKYLELSIINKERASQQDFNKRADALRFEYDNQKKDLTIQVLNKDLEREETQQKFYIVGILMLVLFGLWFWYNNNRLKAKNAQIEHQQTQIVEINSQLNGLNKTLEHKVAERTAELTQANEELIRKNEEIVTAMVAGQTLERKRVATELHDNLGGTITAIKWQLAILETENLNENEKIVYEKVMDMINGAYIDVRHISHNLLPVVFEERGLIGGIEKLCEDLNRNQRLQISFRHQNELSGLNNKIALELYSICLELITNVLKHAKAQTAQITLLIRETGVNLTIEDDGIGLGANLQKFQNGHGLKNITARVQALSGTLSVSSQNGTTTSIHIPLTV